MDITLRMESALRTCVGSAKGYIVCDGRTGKALVKRGLAEKWGTSFRAIRITDAGLELLKRMDSPVENVDRRDDKTCIQCGKPGGRRRVDPYALDVNNERVIVRLHDRCVRDRVDEI